MAIRFAGYSGKSDIGFRQKKNEDYIAFQELGNDTLFAAIADGSGSKGSLFQPASIVTNQIANMLQRIYNKKKEFLLENARFFLEEAMLSANDALIAFKLGDEENNAGFASSITCLLLTRSGQLTFAHAGNTRLYLIHEAELFQMTTDHTEGRLLVDKGVISEEDYYTSLERLQLYNGLGIKSDPFIQTQQYQLSDNDVLAMTSDGIHYSYRAEGMKDIILDSQDLDEATTNLIKTANDMKSFSDNISCNVIQWYKNGGTDRKETEKEE